MKAMLYGLPAALISVLAAGAALAGPVEDGNAGLDALKQGDYKRAEAMFTRALASPKLAGEDREFAYSQRGTAYLKDGAYAAATADFKRALKIKPDDQDAQAGLEEAQSHAGSGSARGGGAGAYRAAAGPDPMQAAQSGMDALNGGDYARAVQLFSVALNSGRLSDDDRELALLSRGKAYLGRGSYSEAAHDLAGALHLKPDDQEAQAGLVKALSQVHARTVTPGIDAATCARNSSAVGSILAGKTYTAFAEYPTLSSFDAFAGVYAALQTYTPVPGRAWEISAVDLDAGSIQGAIDTGVAGKSITLDVRVEAVGGGSKITITEMVPGLIVTVDLKGAVCQTLAAATRG